MYLATRSPLLRAWPWPRGMQIITTTQTVRGLSPMLQLSTRAIAALTVKGKGDEVAVSEVIWQGGEELTMSTASISTRPARPPCT